MAQVKLTSNNFVLTTTSSIHNFSIIKALNITIHPTCAPTIKEVVWNTHTRNWIMCNCNSIFTNSPTAPGSRDIFRDCKGNFIWILLKNLTLKCSLHVEFCAVMQAIEFVREKQ
ncbi:hypothetical protein KIW84_030323 [Lathyrus oleraceus]|uniref:Uncharacterized protein n=1 Tax=Pisum sativum TaxID=3888 RepID=A0A9D4XPD1_PEA|nr:hypothetical protein KIW84_030323 [Pisum sativum]